MTYTPRPGMVPVSVSPYPPASPPTSAVPACTLAGLGKLHHAGRPHNSAPFPFCLGLDAWACVCLVDACRFQVVSMRNQGITSCTARILATGRDSQFHRPRCVSICAQDGQPVLCRVDAQETAPVEEGATTRRRALTLAEATVVLARQILSRHDGLAD